MEAAMAALKLKALQLSGGKEERNAPQTAAEQTAEAKTKAPEGEKFKVLETTEATKDVKPEILARAAEKVARAQIAMVLKSAKAELKHRRRTASLKQKDHIPTNLDENEINETEKK